MKIALLGKGKTGSEVINFLKENDFFYNSDKINLTIFDRSNSPTGQKLKGHDVIISFLTGDVFLEYFDEILSSGIPVVTGSTGFEWTSDLEDKVKKANIPLIFATNFSLGMTIIKKMIQIMGRAGELFDQFDFKIHEVHHTKKQDAPSGTAKSWASWLNNNAPISSERTGDVIGYHELTLHTDTENIRIIHEALDRKIFAKGALWACYKILSLQPGLHDFSILTMNTLMEKKNGY